MASQSTHNIPMVDNIATFKPRGPWRTKSNGELDVLFSIPFELIQHQYLSYEPSELSRLSQDIRGLRSYRVSKLKKGATGANEWHILRNEIVVTIKGSILWNFEDVFGNTLEFTLSQGESVWIPPYIMHTYTSLSPNAELLVLASTLFIPEDTTTHDTFNKESFNALRASYASS